MRKTDHAKLLSQRLRSVESRNVTHLGDHPPFWTEALGATVLDADGNEFIDLTGAFGVAFAGHRHPVIVDRIQRQLSRLIHGMGDVHPPEIKLQLLEALCAMSPWPDAKGVLGNSGSDAIETALKTAHLATGRASILAFEGAYHGLPLGALSVTDRTHFRRPFTDRLTDHVTFLAFPVDEAQADATLESAAKHMGAVGAVIVEPIQGRAGIMVPPPGFLKALAALARSNGALLVFDEIFTGLGRTGRDFAGDWEDTTPDMLCLGKALGGGMPISVCLAPAEVMDAWPESTGEAIHTSTFLGHPLGCSAALGFLQVLEEEGLAARAAALGEGALTYLNGELRGEALEIRGRGLMIGVELPESGAAVALCREALHQGLIVLPAGEDGRVVELTPPATISEDQLRTGLEILVTQVKSAS